MLQNVKNRIKHGFLYLEKPKNMTCNEVFILQKCNYCFNLYIEMLSHKHHNLF